MTIPTTIAASGPYIPNGATVAFPFGFKASSSADVSVVLLSSSGAEEVVSTAAYTVVLAGGDDPGGTVIMAIAPANDGRELWIYLNPTFLQEIKFEDEGAFNQTILNQLADEAGLRSVWLRERVNRAMLLPRAGVALNAVKGKFPYVDASGQLAFVDGSGGLSAAALIAALLGVLSQSAIASEAITAGDFVNLYNNGGVFSMRRAIANDQTKFAHGFSAAAVAPGATGAACLFGLNTHAIPGANASEVWLSDVTPGGYLTAPPANAGSLIQPLGAAVAGSGIFFTPRERVLL